MANKFLEKSVKKIFLGFPDAARYFKEPEKLMDTGNPVRKTFFQLTKKEAREKLGFPQDAFIVLSFGGSLGAEKINEVAFDLMEAVNGQEKVMLIFGTGKWYYEATLKKAEEKGIAIADNVLVKDYLDPMDQYLAACDVVISRAGALSVAETTVCGKAAVLIPSPNVTGNHQYYNAKSVADRGGALLVEEKDLSSEAVIEAVLKLRSNPDMLQEMSLASRRCAPDHALDLIYDTIKG
jgi:UDP-N-acetylglucosamine--N-acetylmuramyl-(pentapeptide) pyrophosphoryl-undecaprenol N-acetylglucosamine transferase